MVLAEEKAKARSEETRGIKRGFVKEAALYILLAIG
jgi:hypothetical protein